MLVTFLQGVGLAFPAVAQPGPLQAFCLSQTWRIGWRRAWPMAFAPLLSDGPIIALVWLALTRLPAWLITGLRLTGGLFLLYLAWSAWRQAHRPNSAPTPSAEAGQRSLLKATLVNLLNPNPYLFWATVAGPLLLAHWRTGSAEGLAFLIGFYGTLVGGLGLLMAGLGWVQGVDQAGRFGRIFTPLSILLLLFFSAYQFITLAITH